MSKLVLERPFELEVGDKLFAGTFKEITKRQSREIKKLGMESSRERIAEINDELVYAMDDKKNDLLKEKHKLEKKIAKVDPEDIFKMRLDLSIVSKDKDKIMAVGEEYGYKRVFETIVKDIAERAEKND